MDAKSCEKVTGAIADKYRLAILLELAKRGCLTPTDIQEITGLSQPCVSHHIKQLTDSELVTATKKGRNLYLAINKDVLRELTGFLARMA